jgi:hypothetical protein
VHCANPNCNVLAVNLNTGILRLIELDMPPDKRVVRSDGGFPVCSVPSRYFWLCESCSSSMRIKRWTPDGLTFVQRTNGGAVELNPWRLASGQASPRHLITVTRKTA